MDKPNPRHVPPASDSQRLGETAHANGHTLQSFRIGALPILDRLLQRMRLQDFLHAYLPTADRRCRISPAIGIILLLKNLLISRQPLYGIGKWAARHDPQALGLTAAQLPSLNDDRIGRCLDQLFKADVSSFVLALAAHVVREFQVDLDELHNDSTSITFHGAYAHAAREETRGTQTRLAITWGYNKDHRPDLKQLLYILTVARDGSVPIDFQVQSGNVADDQTHRATWDLLCQLTGRRDFLYVADCKLATAENMAHIHQRQGKFLSLLPRTRTEDRVFRDALSQGKIHWAPLHDKRDERDRIVDQYSVSVPETVSAEGYRVVWFHSTHKAALDAHARHRHIERALLDLAELRAKLTSPRTRYRQSAKVAEAVQEILQTRDVEPWIDTAIEEESVATFHQAGPGRPSAKTRYVKETTTRFKREYHVNSERLAAETVNDGVFPLITNDRSLPALEMLLAYKRQPPLEKRFSQLKTDFEVAPVYLKEVSRIQALLCVYFLALLTESLLERELRRAMERESMASLPLYPEDRKCARPTARFVIDEFEDVQRHGLSVGGRAVAIFTTQRTTLQRGVLRLLGMSDVYDA
jgi:transposase